MDADALRRLADTFARDRQPQTTIMPAYIRDALLAAEERRMRRQIWRERLGRRVLLAALWMAVFVDVSIPMLVATSLIRQAHHAPAALRVVGAVLPFTMGSATVVVMLVLLARLERADRRR